MLSVKEMEKAEWGECVELHIPSGIVRCPRVCSLFPAARCTKEIFAAKLVSRKSWPELPELTGAWCLLSAAATGSCPTTHSHALPLPIPLPLGKFKKIPKQVLKIQRMWFGARFASVRFGAMRCGSLGLYFFFLFWFQFQSQFRLQFLGRALCLANRRMGGRVCVCLCVGHPCGCPLPGFICCVQLWHAYYALAVSRIANFGLINNICFIRSFPFCLFYCALCPAGRQALTHMHMLVLSSLISQCGFFDEFRMWFQY